MYKGKVHRSNRRFILTQDTRQITTTLLGVSLNPTQEADIGTDVRRLDRTRAGATVSTTTFYNNTGPCRHSQNASWMAAVIFTLPSPLTTWSISSKSSADRHPQPLGGGGSEVIFERRESVPKVYTPLLQGIASL